jgi:integrase
MIDSGRTPLVEFSAKHATRSASATTAPSCFGPLGGRLRRHNFRRLWLRVLDEAGLSGADIHFHDLRHTGNHLAALTGASTKELMARMGHSSVRAAMIYQHATRDRDREIARAMRVELGKEPEPTTEGHAGGTNSSRGPDEPAA